LAKCCLVIIYLALGLSIRQVSLGKHKHSHIRVIKIVTTRSQILARRDSSTPTVIFVWWKMKITMSNRNFLTSFWLYPT